MPTLGDAIDALREIAPLELAEDWDNVGLLVGDAKAELRSVLTCLTLTPDVVEEAIHSGVGLVVTHHPLPFRGVKTLTTGTLDGASLWRLARAGVAVYSPHTAYDSSTAGINQQWADGLGLRDATPFAASDRPDGAGVGRVGLWTPGDRFELLLAKVRELANPGTLRAVTPSGNDFRRVAVACGSGGSLLDAAIGAGCEVFLTGELGFHECLRCRSLGFGVILTGHYASERFGVESLARVLGAKLPGVEVAASSVERDPLQTV